MNEGVRQDDEAREQDPTTGQSPRLVEMRRLLRQSLGNPTLNPKTVSSRSGSGIFGSATRMGAEFL